MCGLCCGVLACVVLLLHLVWVVIVIVAFVYGLGVAICVAGVVCLFSFVGVCCLCLVCARVV